MIISSLMVFLKDTGVRFQELSSARFSTPWLLKVSMGIWLVCAPLNVLEATETCRGDTLTILAQATIAWAAESEMPLPSENQVGTEANPTEPAADAASERPMGETVLQERTTSHSSRAETNADRPRDWFELYGLDESHFAKFVPHRPIDTDEIEPLLKVIYQMRRFKPEQLGRWALREWSIDDLAADSKARQAEVFAVRGDVVEFETVRPPEEVAALFEMPAYFRCRFRVADGRFCTVFAATVPSAWRQESAVFPARGEALAAFLKSAGPSDAPEPVFAAARVAWYPNTPLGNLQFDYGLFDEVNDRAPPESEPFYQLIAAVRRTQPGQLERTAREQLNDLIRRRHETGLNAPTPEVPIRPDPQKGWAYSVLPLFQQAEQCRGKLLSLHGVARQVQKVVVDEPAIRERFGIDHYYQVSVFTDDSGVNPVIFCVLEIPEGMPVGARDRYGEEVRIAGFMMKLWSYRIDIPRGADEDSKTGRMRQRAPLLVARDLTWFPAPPPPPRSSLAALIGLGCIAIAAFVGWWVLIRSDRRALKPKPSIQSPERIEFPDRLGPGEKNAPHNGGDPPASPNAAR